MTRAQQVTSTAMFVTAVYLALDYQLVPGVPDKIQQQIIPVLPLWLLVSFGAYLLGKLGFSLITFNDVPQAHASLMKEIELARADLKANGVDVD